MITATATAYLRDLHALARPCAGTGRFEVVSTAANLGGPWNWHTALWSAGPVRGSPARSPLRGLRRPPPAHHRRPWLRPRARPTAAVRPRAARRTCRSAAAIGPRPSWPAPGCSRARRVRSLHLSRAGVRERHPVPRQSAPRRRGLLHCLRRRHAPQTTTGRLATEPGCSRASSPGGRVRRCGRRHGGCQPGCVSHRRRPCRRRYGVFKSALAAYLDSAEPASRGEAASSLFFLAYLGLIIPVLGIGIALSSWSPRRQCRTSPAFSWSSLPPPPPSRVGDRAYTGSPRRCTRGLSECDLVGVRTRRWSEDVHSPAP